MRRPVLRRFEALETRLALAGLVTFSDIDGDTVTIRTSRGTDTQLSAALTLAPAGVPGGFQLQQVSLFNPAFARTNLTISARPSATGGNGLVDVGEILTSFDLGSVTVGGDLGRIVAGDGNRTTAGVTAFSAASIGSLGTATGALDTFSLITGGVPSVRIAGNLLAARFAVLGRAADVVIGGSIFGTNQADGFEANSIGRLVVGGGVYGGSLADSGRVLSRGGINRLVIRGDLIGGAGIDSGVAVGSGPINFARIGGSISGAGGDNSGGLVAGGTGISQLVVGGNVFGGSGQLAGRVYTTGSISAASVGGSIAGGDGLLSGSVVAGAGIGTIEIGGDLLGGLGAGSGAVSAGGRVGTLRVGRIFAGDGPLSGYLGARSLGTIVVRGDISGSLLQPASIAAVGAATPTGPRAIGSLTVGGSMTKTLVLGGYNGLTPVNGAARIGTVSVRGALVGSSIVAGVENTGTAGPSGMPQFGNGLDVSIAGRRGSRIDSVVVNGAALGGADPTESSGVLANSIGSIRVSGQRYVATRAGITPTSPNLRFQVI